MYVDFALVACFLQVCHASQKVFKAALAPENATYLDILEGVGHSQCENVHVKSFRGAGKTLVYVTPWNTKGYAHAIEFSGKFDYISPVWYTVHRNGRQRYQVRGGPSTNDEDRWLKSIANLRDTSDSQPGKGAGLLVPRFELNSFTTEDFNALLNDGVEQEELIEAIVRETEVRGYNGVVFESIATPLLGKALQALGTSLHLRQKILIAVLPPLRRLHPDIVAALKEDDRGDVTGLLQQEKMLEQQNLYIKSAITTMSASVDGWSIMTYDYTGPGGQFIHEGPLAGVPLSDKGHASIDPSKQVLPTVPGPNSPVSWLQTVVDQFAELPGSWEWELRPKLLMGIAFYGYAYQTVKVDPANGRQLRPGEKSAQGVHVRVLTSPGTAIICERIYDLLKRYKPKILWDDLAKEHYFDYVDDDQDAIRGGHQPGHGHEWRVYIPSLQGIQTRLELFASLETGLSVWELGQADESLVSLL